jgi:beta-lactamase superfamily II metal-dependent hydrolase
MSYREQKNKVDEKVKHLKRVLLFVFVVLLLALFIFSFFYPPESWKYYFSKPKVAAREGKEMRVHYIDVGQGDCIFIELPDGKTMLVDGGGVGAGTEKTVLRYLNALKIDEIDYLLITHADNDHCGAIGEVVRMKKIFNAYLPATNEIKSGAYAEAYAQLSREECALHEANGTVDLSNADETPYTLSFLYPYTKGMVHGDNEGSVVFWLDYMGVSFLFTGDAPTEVEEELMRIHSLELLDEKVCLDSTEIVKLGHHGSSQSSSKSFLEYLNLETAILSCGANNSYGHPAEGVMESLSNLSADVYRTDEMGNIIVTVGADGKYTVKTLKS